jgi:hypothetical protein
MNKYRATNWRCRLFGHRWRQDGYSRNRIQRRHVCNRCGAVYYDGG